jgi:hypothetical protein
MKTVEADQFAAKVKEYLQDSRTEAILVTEAGKPCAIVHGLDYDDEQLELINSRDFWSMIAERRQRPTISWEEVNRRLESLDEK